MNVTFYCNTKKKVLKVIEFYKQDIEILNELGYGVKIATKWSEIDLRSDVIFIWWWTYAFVPVLLGKLFSIKTIITGTFNFRCPLVNRDYSRRKWFQRKLIKFSTKFCNANILVSKHEYGLLSSEWDYNNFYYSPHCVDNIKYGYSKKREDNLIFLICWTERLNIQRKCLYEVIEAAEILKNTQYNLKFIIAGRKGDGFEDISNIIKQKKLTDTIKLIGEIDEQDKISFLQKCTIYLQPSKYEGFGLAIAEAMSCGAPVISSDAGEVKNVIGKAGVLLPYCKPDIIADSIIALINSTSKRQELSKMARKKIETDFPKSRRKDEIKKIIERIVR